MPFDHLFLASLYPDEPESWAREVHERLFGEPREMAGALLLAQGRPFAVVWTRLVDLHVMVASPGGLLWHALCHGADGIVPFHTQVTVSEAEIERADLLYAQRLRDLAQLVGGVRVVEHLLVGPDPEPLWLGGDVRLAPPVSLKKMEAWRRRTPVQRLPCYRHPVLGRTWSGVGKRPSWVLEGLAIDFLMEDFAIAGGGKLVPRGVPEGGGIIRSVDQAPVTPDLTPRPPLRVLDAADGLQVTPAVESLARALGRFARAKLPQVGIVYVGDDGEVAAPWAGVVGPEEAVRERPGELFRPAVRSGAARGVTFSTVPAGEEPFSLERRDLVRRLVFLGELLGLSLVDHLALRADGTWTSLKTTTTWKWPRVPPLAEPLWPPFRRARQTARLVQHPHDGRIWDERGTAPPWVERFLESGWSLEELRVYL